MDYIFLVLSGIIIGLIVAVPIGPVNVICIRRTLAFGPVVGFVSGLGAALGDSLFAIVTAFGLTAVMQLIEGFSTILELAGGISLIVFGLHTYRSKPMSLDERQNMRENQATPALLHSIASTFALTITNPATLLGFAALFAGVGGLVGGEASYFYAGFIVAGVAMGSALWWLALSTTVGYFHARIDEHVMRIINKGSGFVVAAFGVGVLVHLAAKVL